MNINWHKRLFNPSRFIKPQKIYILPTFSGLKLFAVNILMLLVGLIFANNFVLFFDFLLFGLFICSMFYTHFNLDQIEVISFRFIPSYSQEPGQFKLVVKNLSQLPKTGLTLVIPQSNLWQTKDLVYFDLGPHEIKEILFSVKLLKRGISDIKRIELQTVYPFNFFRSFTYALSNCEIVVYPARDQLTNLQNLPQEMSISRLNEDDLSLVKQQPGASLSRLFWKRFALTGEMYSRHHAKASEPIIKLDWQDLPTDDFEKKIILMTSLLSHLEDRAIPWEAKILEQTFHSKQLDLHQSLKTLAVIT